MNITKETIELQVEAFLSSRRLHVNIQYVEQYNELHTQNGYSYTIYPSEVN